MKKRSAIRFALFTLVLLSAMSVSAGSWKNDDFSLAWTVEGSELLLTVSAPTTGWVAVGFGPSRMMKDANIVIGAVLPDGGVMAEDHFGTGLTSHGKDTENGGAANLRVISGEERNGTTTISFAIPLESGDPKDARLVPGSKIVVILASSSRDTFTSKHTRKAKAEIQL